MTLRHSRFLSLAVLGSLALGAGAAWACDATKSAKATACAPKAATTVTASTGKSAVPARAVNATRKAAPAAVKAGAAATARKAAPAEAGMKAFRDPETGEIVSLPILSESGPDGLPLETTVVLVEEALPGGGYTVDLKGTLQEYSVLHVDAKGRRHMSCSKDPRTALKRVPSVHSNAFPEE